MTHMALGASPKGEANALASRERITAIDQTISAIAGSIVVHLLVCLKCDAKIRRELWPRIMSNAIEACMRANAKLTFFDNVHMYGKVVGPMTKKPCSTRAAARGRSARR
jgi:hypothetical protein